MENDTNTSKEFAKKQAFEMRPKTSESPGAVQEGLGATPFEKALEILKQVAGKNKKMKLDNLISLFTKETLTECFHTLKKGKAPGVDGITVEEYEKNLQRNLTALSRFIHQNRYKPEPMKRFFIKKDDGGKRPLSIVSTKDTIIHTVVKRILETIYEEDFFDFSFGFRPGRNCTQALEFVEKVIIENPVNFIIDADIKGFFDNVEHQILVKCMGQRIIDRRFLELVNVILNAGYIESNTHFKTERGVPQGAVCSPVMANIFLHYLVDSWIEKIVKVNADGYIGMVRYADDFLIFAEKKKEAICIKKTLDRNLQAFGMTLSKEKTKFVSFGKNALQSIDNTFDFLGFQHLNDRTPGGKYIITRKPLKTEPIKN